MSFLEHLQAKVVILLLAIFFAISVTNSHENQGQEQLISNLESIFSVGFSLQSSYGAAAVIFEDSDGNLKTYTRVYEASSLYRQVMKKLSLESSEHIAPPYQNDGEYWADQPRKAARMALKTTGLPASYEVGVLSHVIKHLRSQLESDFDITISEAVFTSSHLRAFYQDDLEDVAFDSGVKYVTPRAQFQPILWETASAYAGSGFGMCKHWQDEDRCRDEESKILQKAVLAVHYSRNALTVSLAEIETAASTWEPNYRRVENFTLGSDAIAGYTSLNDYWADVKWTLLETMVTFPLFPRPNTILVTGDRTESLFVDFLKETLVDYLGNLPPVFSADPTVVSAKGAAEFMRRGT